MITPIETERLILREIVASDAEFMFSIYGNPEFMRYIGPKAESLEEIEEMIQRIRTRHYEQYGFGTMLVINKESGEPIGACGLLMQEVDGRQEHEVAYGLHPRAQGFGFAIEAARAVKEWGIREFGLERIISIVPIDNKGSASVALRNGMKLEKVTTYKDMSVDIYAWEKD